LPRIHCPVRSAHRSLALDRSQHRSQADVSLGLDAAEVVTINLLHQACRSDSVAVQLSATAAAAHAPRQMKAENRGRRRSQLKAMPAQAHVSIPVGDFRCPVVFTYLTDRKLVLAKCANRDAPRALLDSLWAQELSEASMQAITSAEFQAYGRPYRCEISLCYHAAVGILLRDREFTTAVVCQRRRAPILCSHGSTLTITVHVCSWCQHIAGTCLSIGEETSLAHGSTAEQCALTFVKFFQDRCSSLQSLKCAAAELFVASLVVSVPHQDSVYML
jgi:hypothetical protein